MMKWKKKLIKLKIIISFIFCLLISKPFYANETLFEIQGNNYTDYEVILSLLESSLVQMFLSKEVSSLVLICLFLYCNNSSNRFIFFMIILNITYYQNLYQTTLIFKKTTYVLQNNF